MKSRVTAEEVRVRALRLEDLERIVHIDQAHAAAVRRAFLGKRLAAAQERPECYFSLGVEQHGTLVGFALGRLLSGEFGQLERAAVLDAIGIDPARQEQGLGHRLLNGVISAVRAHGVRKLYSQADWTRYGLLKFFHSSGFVPSARLVLERRTSLAFAEAAPEP